MPYVIMAALGAPVDRYPSPIRTVCRLFRIMRKGDHE
jgi:hypothetical protein